MTATHAIATPSLSALVGAEFLQRHDLPCLGHSGSGRSHQGHALHPANLPFSTWFQEKDLRQIAAVTNGDPIPRPLALHLHFPSRADLGAMPEPRTRSAAYLTRLYREIALLAVLFDRDRQVEQVHLAGWTLGFLQPEQVVEAMDVLSRHFSLSPAPRTARSIRIDPDAATAQHIAQIADAGFDRAILAGWSQYGGSGQGEWAIDRLPMLVQACRGHGLSQVQVDLRLDLPGRSAAELAQALDALLQVRPDRLRIGADEASTLDAATRMERLRCMLDRLQQAGYSHLGMYCFALPGDELFQARQRGTLHCDPLGYSARAECDVVGVGLGAVSQLGASISQSLHELPEWENAIDRGRLPVWRGIRLDEERLLCADVVQHLVCRGEVDFGEINRTHGVEFRERFAEALRRLEPLAAERLVELSPDRLRVTMRGRLALPTLAACFDTASAACAGFPPRSLHGP